MQSRALVLFLLAHFVQNISYAQSQISALHLRKDTWLAYSFPLVHSSNKQTAFAINSTLQSEILYNETVITDSTKVFEASRYIGGADSNSQSGHSMINYKVELNNAAVISFSFDIESTGAYSENYFRYLNFNNRTGELLSAKDLFTENGIEEIKKLLIHNRKTLIKKWVRQIREDNENKEDSAWISDTFRECNENAEEDNFILKSQRIVFCKENCFPHMARPYDTNLDVSLSYQVVSRYLSEKGKKLLIQKK
jgi:hypothetical protein